MVLGTELPFASKLGRGLCEVTAKAASISQIGCVAHWGAGQVFVRISVWLRWMVSFSVTCISVDWFCMDSFLHSHEWGEPLQPMETPSSSRAVFCQRKG